MLRLRRVRGIVVKDNSLRYCFVCGGVVRKGRGRHYFGRLIHKNIRCVNKFTSTDVKKVKSLIHLRRVLR